MKTYSLLTLSVGLGIFTCTAQAAPIADYLFSGNGNPSGVAENITADVATWQFHTSQPAGTYGFSVSSGTAYANMNITASSLNLGDYIEVRFSADSGYELNLSSMTFVFGGSVATTSATGATVYCQVRSDAETVPYSTDLSMTPGPVSIAATSIANDNVTTWNNFTVDLSGADFQGKSEVTLRLYVYDDLNQGSSYLRFDSISLDGTVTAIPEPATCALAMSVALAGLVLRRRVLGVHGKAREE